MSVNRQSGKFPVNTLSTISERFYHTFPNGIGQAVRATNNQQEDSMQNLQIIESRNILNHEVTVYGDVENPLFLAKDVAAWLEHSNSRSMLNSVDPDEKIKRDPGVTIPYAGGDREQWFLTENGLYEVLFQCRKPVAKEFKREVKKLLHNFRQNLLASLDQSRRLDVARAEERARFWESNRRTVTANGNSVRLPANTRLSEVSITKNGTMTIRFTPER